MVDGESWIANSLQLNLSEPDQIFTYFVYAVLSLSVFVILHSFSLHERNFKKLRICTDIAAITTLIQASCYLSCDSSCSPASSVYLLNIVSVSICGTINQICDNYIVFDRYRVVVSSNVSTNHFRALVLYLIIFMYLSWWPFYNIIPIFINLNSTSATNITTIFIQYFFFAAYSFYDIFYTTLVIIKLREISMAISETSNLESIRTISRNSIIHNIISIGGVAAYCYYSPYGILIYNVCTMTSLHFLFNMKVSSRVLPRPSRSSLLQASVGFNVYRPKKQQVII